MKFIIRATALCILGGLISIATDSTAQLCALMAFLIAAFHGALADFIRYRRLVYRLGGIHQIFANADQMKYLPILMRSQKALNRWWCLQLGYELALAAALLVLVPVYLGSVMVTNWWMVAPALPLAMVVLTGHTVRQIWLTRLQPQSA